jgi:hypothetical protein
MAFGFFCLALGHSSALSLLWVTPAVQSASPLTRAITMTRGPQAPVETESRRSTVLQMIPGLPNPFGGSKSTASSLHEITVNDIDGKSVNLGKYKGKVVLVVNVASR